MCERSVTICYFAVVAVVVGRTKCAIISCGCCKYLVNQKTKILQPSRIDGDHSVYQ